MHTHQDAKERTANTMTILYGRRLGEYVLTQFAGGMSHTELARTLYRAACDVANRGPEGPAAADLPTLSPLPFEILDTENGGDAT